MMFETQAVGKLAVDCSSLLSNIVSQPAKSSCVGGVDGSKQA